MRTDVQPDFFTLDEELAEGYSQFPGEIYLLSVGDGKYAANNVTIADVTHNGLATFPSMDDTIVYTGLLAGLNGSPVRKTFEEARAIAVSKPTLDCMFLFVDGKIVDIHFVR